MFDAVLVKRALSTLILALLTVTTIFVGWLAALVITVLIAIGLYEFFTMLEHKGISIYKYFGIGIGIIIPFSVMLRFEPTKIWELLFIVAALLFLIVMQLRRRQNTGAIVGISTTVFGILYVSWFLSFLIKIRYMHDGLALLAAVILITKLGDIGCYLIGVRFGRTPLIPRISPNKSVEGSFGGLVFSIGGALLSGLFLDFPFQQLLFLGLFLGGLAQVGDLSESLMKRDCQIKDSGHSLPGIGGVLDLIDSLLFTAPAFYFYLSTFKLIE